MANRTTVKSNIVTKCVPTVSNADMIDMLNAEMNDNVRFREDVVAVQTSTANRISCNFTGKERINLTRTGGSLDIDVSGIGDGEEKWLQITKTAGQSISWYMGGVIDITPCKANITAASVVTYQIIRKGNYYYSQAWIEAVKAATDAIPGVISPASVAEANALTTNTKALTPGRVPKASATQQGIVEIATSAEIDAGTDTVAGRQMAVQPSELLRKLLQVTTPPAWSAAVTLQAGWHGNVQYFLDTIGNIHVRGLQLYKNADIAANVASQFWDMVGLLNNAEYKQFIMCYDPATFHLVSGLHIYSQGSSGMGIRPAFVKYDANNKIDFYAIFRYE